MADDAGHYLKSFWINPVSRERIFFVNSADSEEFRLFGWAMERAFIVGMDSEWKAAFLSNSSRTPRVSIFQIACRIYDYDEEHISEDNDQNKEVRVSVEEHFDGFAEGADVSGDMQNFVSKIEEAKWRRKLFGEVGNGEESRVQELIFLLDLLVLPISSFGKTLRSVLISVDILKLGFKFKQDLMYLAGTFSSEEAYSCFSMVDPYIDIGKVYNYLQNHDSWSLSKGRNKMLIQQSKGLSSICEEVLGFKLSKDLQCSDWEQRPLMNEQIAYAAADAYCLIRIFDVVHQKVLDLDQGAARNEITDSSISTAIIGLRELLSSPLHNGNKNIVRAKFGLAADIVKETMKGSLSVASLSSLTYKRRKLIPFYKPISKITQIIGERILLSECESKARLGTRKRRSRRFRTSEINIAKTIERYSEWEGPPPWDPSLGGDRIPRFLCDVMVEGLAKQLRCVGIDAATPCVKKADPRQLLEQAHTEKRVLLTRDTKLLRRNLIPNNQAYRVKNLAKQEQLIEVIEIFNLQISEYQLMSRCIKCNGKFIEKSLTKNEAIEAATSEQVIPECLVDLDLEFWQCSDCQQIYWEDNDPFLQAEGKYHLREDLGQGTQYHNAIQQFSSICKVND